MKSTPPKKIKAPTDIEHWTSIYRQCSTMSQESIEKILDDNNWAHNAMVLLDYRKELSQLCQSKGVSRFAW